MTAGIAQPSERKRHGRFRRRLLRAATVASFLALAAVPLGATPAASHALLEAAEPKPGATLEAAPEIITLTFTEEPEIDLSSITVVEQSGAVRLEGKPVPDASDRRVVTFPIDRELPQGVYTVTWRVLSTVDGHITAGTVQFGVGVPPVLGTGQDIAGTAGEARPLSPIEIGSRWVFTAGILLLLGGSWVSLVAFRSVPPAVWALLLAGAALALIAVLGLAAALGSGAGVGPIEYLGTGAGRMLLVASGALVVAGSGLAMARVTPAAPVGGLVIASVGGLGALVANVAGGHAAAGESPWASIVVQSVHFTGAGLWIGGLAALLLGVRGAVGEEKAVAVRRFSASAVVALGLVVATGTVRAVGQLERWGDLVGTGYGRAILVKIVLLLALASLGAVNRYRNVPRAGRSLAGLRRVSAAELALGAGVLVATALLVSLPPPYEAGPEHAEVAELPTVVAEGANPEGDIHAVLEITPGAAGPNRFTLRLQDVATDRPVPADDARLEFAPLDRDRTIAGSPLPLQPQGRGVFEAVGANIGGEGHWRITAIVGGPQGPVEIPLTVGTGCDAERIGTEAPAVYDIRLSSPGTVQGLLGRIGRDRYEIHFTFLGPEGGELRMGGGRIWRWRPGEADPEELQARRLGPGHFVARSRLEPGAWRFQVAADEQGDGESLRACFEEQIAR